MFVKLVQLKLCSLFLLPIIFALPALQHLDDVSGAGFNALFRLIAEPGDATDINAIWLEPFLNNALNSFD